MKKINSIHSIHSIILTVGIILSCSTSYYLYSIIETINHNRFQSSSDKLMINLEEIVSSYTKGLKDVAGVFISQNFYSVKPESYKKYALSRDYFKSDFPGAFGLGFIFYVKKNNLDEYLKQAQKRQGPDFKIKSDFKHDDYFIIEYIEPEGNNKAAKGYDIGQETLRRQAAESAMRSGQPTLTKKIQLVQDSVKRSGFLYLNPVYSTITVPVTEKERIEKFVGFSYSPLVISELIRPLASQFEKLIDIHIYQDDQTVKDNLVYDSDDKNEDQAKEKLEYEDRAHSKLIKAQIGNQTWIIELTNESYFDDINAKFISLICFSIGLLITALIYSLYNSILKRDLRATQLAENMTTALTNKNKDIERAFAISQANEHQLETIVNAIPGLVSWFNSDLIYEGVNHEFLNLFNVNSTDFIGKKLGVTFKSSNPFVSLVSEFMRSSKQRQSSFVDIELNKVNKYLFVNLQKYNNGKNLLIISIDYTEQKRLEKEIQNAVIKSTQSSKMSSLGEMAGSISHEINNPLAIISSKAQSLKKIIQNGNLINSNAEDLIEKIIITTDRISKIIRGLRVIARDGENDSALPVDVNKLVEDTLELCSARLKNHGITLETKALNSTLVIYVRETQIMQVLLNLINNAHDAIVDMNSKFIRLEIIDRGDFIDFVVTDSGLGIPKDVREKLMQPFFTTKEIGQGMGLGLSISKSIVEAHGGILYINSRSSNTQFIVRLPKDGKQLSQINL